MHKTFFFLNIYTIKRRRIIYGWTYTHVLFICLGEKLYSKLEETKKKFNLWALNESFRITFNCCCRMLLFRWSLNLLKYTEQPNRNIKSVNIIIKCKWSHMMKMFEKIFSRFINLYLASSLASKAKHDQQKSIKMCLIPYFFAFSEFFFCSTWCFIWKHDLSDKFNHIKVMLIFRWRRDDDHKKIKINESIVYQDEI